VQRDLRKREEELPVLAALGKVQLSVERMDVTGDAMLVCKYLRAYEDGSIDQLYASGGALDLVILMDCTSSMGSWISEAHAKSIQLVSSASAKFKVKMRTAFVAYRDHCDGSRRIDLLDFTANKTTLTNFIRDYCGALGGGDTPEDVAGGLEVVNSLSWQEGSQRLVCHFADAPAHGNTYNDTDDTYPRGCPRGLDPANLLRQLASRIKANYYFVNVANNNLNDKMLRVFRSVYAAYPDRDFNVYQLGSDASRFLGTMQDSVGRTVSERIEEDSGDVDSKTCLRLMQKYMRLSERKPQWSMMKQTHWLQYLRRRVHILRNSAKFNKNKEMTTFGSTTMKIMLDEVIAATTCPQSFALD
jgi:hypothetical protein